MFILICKNYLFIIFLGLRLFGKNFYRIQKKVYTYIAQIQNMHSMHEWGFPWLRGLYRLLF